MNCILCRKEVNDKVTYRNIRNNEVTESSYINLKNEYGKYKHICLDCFSNNESILSCPCCNKKYIINKNFNSHDECPHCYLENFTRYNNVLGYNYKPNPIFFGKKNSLKQLFMGIELETDESESCESLITFEDYILNQNNYGYSFFYGKSDGSLSHLGIEIVSHPATLEYHLNNEYWKAMLEKAASINLKSNDCNNCGIHIHCDKDYFTNLEIQKLDAFVNLYDRTFRRFARRNPCHYGRFNRNKTINQLGINNFNERYSALNFENSKTIEWRIFKGNLKYESIMALFELVQGTCDFVKQNNVTLDFIYSENKYIVKKTFKEYLESLHFTYLPAYTEMCRVWRDLEA